MSNSEFGPRGLEVGGNLKTTIESLPNGTLQEARKAFLKIIDFAEGDQG